jgi:hypothetical protein
MSIRLRHASLAAALIVSFAAVTYPQTPATNDDPNIPVFRAQVIGYIAGDFSQRVWSYLELRSKLEHGVPPLIVTDNPADILWAQHVLAGRIRVARAGAKQGEIFTPAIRDEFRKVLLRAADENTRDAIMDDNPGEFAHRINSTYQMGKPVSTMPRNILAALPVLPDDIQYRFLGRHLVLVDTRANVILDRIVCAIQCKD